MYQPLAPCPSCARHVRAVETRCPFCAATLGSELANGVVPGTAQRMGRAAAFVFSASVAIAGCGAVVGPDGGTTADVVVDGAPADNGNVGALYGLPAPVDSGVPDTGSGGARYGAPPPPPDAGPDDNGGGSADYGSPPPIDGG